MTRNIILSIFILTGSLFQLSAQNTRFITEGSIQFERTINVHAITKKLMEKQESSFSGQIMDQVKKQPQFKVLTSTLYFSKNKTLFKPAEDESTPIPWFSNNPEFAQLNTIFADYNTQQQTTQKKVFEETFLIRDSTRHINWKITSETREIAGYQCRRANAIVMDSIYVVAFYTDLMPVSGGPESFNGLPGMILGVALPHDNVTWFAKTVTDQSIESKVMVPPAKGKATDKKGFNATLASALKGWGDYAKSYLRLFNL